MGPETNLEILFRAKNSPSAIEYPSEASVDNLRRRMKRKGWCDYLFKGNGLQKPIQKLARGIEERRVRDSRPREILDQLLRGE